MKDRSNDLSHDEQMLLLYLTPLLYEFTVYIKTRCTGVFHGSQYILKVCTIH